MSENQAEAYGRIVTQPAPKPEGDMKQQVMKKLLNLAEPGKDIHHDIIRPDEELIEVKSLPELRQQIEIETRQMFKQMKVERNGAESNVEYHTIYPDVDRTLPSFLRQMLRENASTSLPQLADMFIPYVLDRGLFAEQQFGKDRAAKVEMLNRSAFSTYITGEREKRRKSLLKKKVLADEDFTDEVLDQEVDAQFNFRLIDIKDFRASDFAKDGQGNRGADLTINKVALKCNKMVRSINEILKGAGIDGSVTMCRYGGDELGMAFVGIEDPKLRSVIYSVTTGINETGDETVQFENGIKTVKGYFDRGGETMYENVDLKAGLEEIRVPPGAKEKEVFWEQFNVGLILNNQEVADIVKQRDADPGVHLATGRREPVKINNEAEFMAYTEQLKERHPEMAEAIAKLQEMQDKIPGIYKELPKFVADILYDRLLGEKVTTFQDFSDRLSNNSISEVFMFDMKGIKEFNDTQSIAVGDQAIATLWNDISNKLGPDFSKVMCFRRGSTIVVGLRQGVKLSQDARTKLQGLTAINFQGSTFDLGYDRRTVDQTFTQGKEGRREVRNWIEEVIVDTHEDWNRRVIDNDLLTKPEILDKKLAESAEKGKKFTREQGLSLFFNGKRAIDRYDRLIVVADKMREEAVQDQEAHKAEEYRRFKDTMIENLFSTIIPTKLAEYRASGDDTKMRETFALQEKLARKFAYALPTEET